MPEMKSYRGQCHCGAVRYTVSTDLTNLFDCNCSRCRRVASVMSAVPATAFTLEVGAEELTRYSFNHHAIDHLFCRTCGVQSFSRGRFGDTPMVMLNVGCLEGAPHVDRSAITHYNGAGN